MIIQPNFIYDWILDWLWSIVSSTVDVQLHLQSITTVGPSNMDFNTLIYKTNWVQVSDKYKNIVTHNGRIPAEIFYFNDVQLGNTENEPVVFSEEYIQTLSIKSYQFK